MDSTIKKLITPSEIGGILGNLPMVSESVDQHQIKEVVLDLHIDLQNTLFRLQKGWILEFRMGPSLRGKEISLYTNHPVSAEKRFLRHTYRELKWEKTKDDSDNVSLVAKLPLHRAGNFRYYFKNKLRTKRKPLGSGYFIVDPVLSFDENEVLSLDSIKCHSIITKCLGNFENWEDRLRVSKESGYNIIHFSPLQVLGASRSAYSLKDHLTLSPFFSTENRQTSFDDVMELTNKMRKEWKVLSIGDVVLNNTATDTPWLLDDHLCTYNMVTARNLIPAAILDGYLHVFSRKVSQGLFIESGIPTEITSELHVAAVERYLVNVMPYKMRLHEFYIADIVKLAEDFEILAGVIPPKERRARGKRLELINGPNAGRKKATIDMMTALEIFNIRRDDSVDEESRIHLCSRDLIKCLKKLNKDKAHECMVHLTEAITNTISYVRCTRTLEDGPKLGAVTEQHPLVPRYFTGQFLSCQLLEREILKHGTSVMALDGRPSAKYLKNFYKDTHVNELIYLRREMIPKKGAVKLRYGRNSSDSPFLWDLMKKYVRSTVLAFDGIRLDNCTFTPLHVTQHFIDYGRGIKPDLYVVAELPSKNDEDVNNIYINRLGINSLIRESISAKNSHALEKLLKKYSRKPADTFLSGMKSPLIPTFPHILFYDVAHENTKPVVQKSIVNFLPNSAIVSMARCGTGSCRGYDELVPHYINNKYEIRLYRSWTDDDVTDSSVINATTGIISAKRCLNEIHQILSEEGFTQMFVRHLDKNILLVARQNPVSQESIILLAHTVYQPKKRNYLEKPNLKKFEFEGKITKILLEAAFLSNQANFLGSFQRDRNYITGLTVYTVNVRENLKVSESLMLKEIRSAKKNHSAFELVNFKPGSIIIFSLTKSKLYKSLSNPSHSSEGDQKNT